MLKSPTQLHDEAITLAQSFEYVYHKDILYAPVDYLTLDGSVIPDNDHKSWIPMDDKAIQVRAREQFNTIFKNRAQASDFMFMVEQNSTKVRHTEPWLLIKTAKGLKVLHEDGRLHDPDGTFVPNTINWTLNEDPDDKAQLLATITEWVGGEEEIAISLLRHLATALAPHWSAGKYVLLIGDGRNGKSVLMLMLQKLFGQHNCSSITRQQISEADKGLFDLNGMLVNIVFDGPAEFLKDSGREKSLITGESINIRKLYSTSTSPVQTNALFIEGLNQEPKSRDKSGALQARLVRFIFPNTYKEDAAFQKLMGSERMLGALLSLLIDNYVLEDDKAVMLAPTQASIEAQLEHMVDNSLGLQFIMHLEETEPLGAEATLVGMTLHDLTSRFQSWRLKNNDIGSWEMPAVAALFRPLLVTDRKSGRVKSKATPVKIRYVSAVKSETLIVLQSMKEDEDTHATAVVDD